MPDGKGGLEIPSLPSFPLPPEFPAPPAAPKVQETSVEERYMTEAEVEASRNGSVPTEAPQTALSGTEAIAEAFRNHLRRVAEDEARRGTTLIGPQRDDLCFLINGADSRIYGSQGQQRTVILALKLAEFRLIEDYVGEPPVLLLDDVMSDLDDARRRHLLSWIRRRGQTFLTCTNLRAFPKEILAEATTFQVVAGTIIPDGKRKSRNPGAGRADESIPTVSVRSAAETE